MSRLFRVCIKIVNDILKKNKNYGFLRPIKITELLQEVSKDLVRLPLSEQPTDFQELCNLIGIQIKK
jgi:hypothetical protein